MTTISIAIHFELQIQAFWNCVILLLHLWVGVGGFSKVVATFSYVGGSFIFWWPPPVGVWIIPSFQLVVMCCMLSTFRDDTRNVLNMQHITTNCSQLIVANISEPSLLFSSVLISAKYSCTLIFHRPTLDTFYDFFHAAIKVNPCE